MSQYKKLNNDYVTIKERAHSIIELALKDAGIMAITTSRVKDADRLYEKLVEKKKKKKYLSAEDIKDDVPDFIGVRIALYFPNDREKVRTLIYELFDIEKEKLVKLEQAVKVLEKHKERHREIYIEEEKAAELKQYSELGVTRFFRQNQEKLEQEEQDILNELKKIEGSDGY